jgi:hypothetical protein
VDIADQMAISPTGSIEPTHRHRGGEAKQKVSQANGTNNKRYVSSHSLAMLSQKCSHQLKTGVGDSATRTITG